MALELVTDHAEPGLVSSAVPPHPVALTASEITGLIGLFQTMLDAMENRIIGRLDENAATVAARWAKHDAELAENTKRVTARFERVEASIDTTARALQAHLDREHDEDIATQARVKPVKTVIGWLWVSRRDIIIVLIGIGVAATFLVESFGRIIGPHAP